MVGLCGGFWRQFSHSNNEKPLLCTRSAVLQTYDTGTIYTSRIQLPSHLVIAVSAATAVKRGFTFEDFKAGLNIQKSPLQQLQLKGQRVQ